MIGGVRSRFYMREMVAPSCSVGAVLRPGAWALLFGVSADELAERHTPLADLWGAWAGRVHERLLEGGSAEERLAILEAVLASRLPRVRTLHPAIAAVLEEMDSFPSIEAAVQRSGISHRSFVAQFHRTVGLGPKTYMRIRRFQQALCSLRRSGDLSLAGMAVDAGYSDQAHFSRDFKAFAGVTPTTYLRLSPREANHVPIDMGTDCCA
jgi:AraC-like DNA-binding protein